LGYGRSDMITQSSTTRDTRPSALLPVRYRHRKKK